MSHGGSDGLNRIVQFDGLAVGKSSEGLEGLSKSICMPKPTVETESYRDNLLRSLRKADEADHYLNACLEDDDKRVFRLALRDVADARGGIRAF